MAANFDSSLPEFIESRVLNAKFEHWGSLTGGSLTDHLIENDPEAFAVDLQNVCAKLPRQFVKEMDSRLDLLNINKREFIAYALHYALNMVDAEIERRGLVDHLIEVGILHPVKDEEAA